MLLAVPKQQKHVIGSTQTPVTKAIINFFEDGTIPDGVNKTVIVLIPKEITRKALRTTGRSAYAT